MVIVVSVKRILAVAATLIALTGCDPYYGQEPYGPEPYPYPQPTPYPPQEPYPGGGYPGQAPYQPAVPECLITSSREWTAWVNRMPGPGARPMLVVSGKVVAPTGGYQVAFDPRMQIRESYPAQAFVTSRSPAPEVLPRLRRRSRMRCAGNGRCVSRSGASSSAAATRRSPK